MDPAPPEERTPPSSFWTSTPFRVLIVVLVLAISLAILLLRDQIAQIGAVGYAGIFLVSLVGNATVIMPAPSLTLVFAMGSALSPWLVGLAAGTGEALGELTGYGLGFGGQALIENRRVYDYLAGWMERRGDITIFVLSAIPNPFFDLAGIAAGASRYPLRRFLFICWLGKVLKTTAVAWMGAQGIALMELLFH